MQIIQCLLSVQMHSFKNIVLFPLWSNLTH